MAKETDEPFFEPSDDLLCILGFEGRLQKCNDSWKRLLGFSDEDLDRRLFWDLVHPDDRAATILAAQRLLVGQDRVCWENRFRRKDGSYLRVRWLASAEPRTQLIRISGRDISGEEGDGAAKVLLVEDNDDLRMVLGMALMREGFDVLAASDAEKALALCRELGERLHVLVTDLRLPGMGGGELAIQARRLCPGLKVVAMSGDHTCALPEGAVLLEKPFRPDALAAKVREALRGGKGGMP